MVALNSRALDGCSCWDKEHSLLRTALLFTCHPLPLWGTDPQQCYDASVRGLAMKRWASEKFGDVT